MKLSESILDRIFRVVAWRPLLTVSIAFTLAGLSIFYTMKNLDVETSQRALISSENRLIQLTERLEKFEDLDTFIVTIEGRDRARALEFLHALAPVLEKDREHYAQVFYRVDPERFKPWGLLYLDEKELQDIRDTLEEHHKFLGELVRSPDVNNLFLAINREMTTGMVAELFTGFLDDSSSSTVSGPPDLTLLIHTLESMDHYLAKGIFQSPWESFLGKPAGGDDSDGYFWTENKRYLMLFVTPVKAESGFGQAQQSLSSLRKTVADLKAGFDGVEVGVTGQEALNVDEMTLAMKDMELGTILSLVGLILLLVVFWKGSRLPLFGVTELLVALCLTFGLTTLTVGHLNILSVVFAPLLLGLGIDNGTHWLSRYLEEVRTNGLPRREAVRKTMTQLGPGIVSAGSCAALSFFPLALTGFKGLAELGIICAMGMVMTTMTAICLLPAVTLLFDRGAQLPAVSRHRPLIHFTKRRAAAIAAVSCAALAASLYMARGVSFDLNMLHLQSKSAESVTWEMKLLNDSKRSSVYGAVLAGSIEEVRSKSKALSALPTVSEVMSADSFLPNDQAEKLEQFRQMRPLLPAVHRVPVPEDPVDVPELSNTLSRISFKMGAAEPKELKDKPELEKQMSRVRELIRAIDRRLGEDSKTGAALQGFQAALARDLDSKLATLQMNLDRTRPVQLSDLPKELLERYVDDNRLFLLRVFPSQDIWEPEFLGRFVDDLRSVDPDVIGDPVTLHIFTKAFRDACIKAVLYAMIFIVVLLLCIFRNVVQTLLAMLPLLLGTAWTVGLMPLFGINFNLANTIFLPMIVGAGVEYAIIIIQRWRSEGPSGTVLPESTGKGVILAGLTTTVGFGSLMVSGHQGIYSLGLLAGVGSLCVLIAALVTLPALLHLLPGPGKGKAA
ncbi:MAG: MMPL family transporter [Desulfobacteraceae bacterium]|nr:MMPL family transporter [Desulfobacteraceae bacterium]